MNEEIKSGEGSAEASEVLVGEAGPEQVGEAIGEPRGEGTEIPQGETAVLESAGAARFRHTNGGTAVVDVEQNRYLVWAGDPAEVDDFVAGLNADQASAERFTWTGGQPSASTVAEPVSE